MSNPNFQIGNSPIGLNEPCKLTFHEFPIYDSINWTQTGILKWDALNKCFFVLPDPVEPQPPL